MPLSMTELAVTADEARDYVGLGGLSVMLYDTDIMRGQRYIAARFNSRWLVEFDNAAAPDAVRHAIIEAALVEQSTPGALSPTSTPGTDKVLVQAGKLAWERIGSASAPDAYIPRIAAVDGLLTGLVRTIGLGFTAMVV